MLPPPLPPPKYLPGLGLPGPPNHDRIPSIDSNASWEARDVIARMIIYGSGNKRLVDHTKRRGLSQYELDIFVNRVRGHNGHIGDLSSGSRAMSTDLEHHSSQDSLPKKLFMSHNLGQFNKSAASDYDSHLLKKLDSRRVFDNRSPPRRPDLLCP